MPILFENPPDAPAHWQPGPPAPALPTGEVHLWRARLDGAPERGIATLSTGEIIRAGRCASAAERSRFLAARVFLRDVLARYLRVAPGALRLGGASIYTSAACGTLRFTLSEAEDLALLAVSRSSGLGVDVERVRDDLPFDEMAACFFEPDDQWRLRTVFPREQKAWKFFDFWTTGEARSKAAPMHPFSTERQPLSMHRLSPAEGFLAAVAVRETAGETDGAPSPRLALWDWC